MAKTVTLHSKQLGPREFHPEHAERLLALEKRLGVSHWEQKTDASQTKSKKNHEIIGGANTSDINSPEKLG
jgi:hypothetical protein